MVSHTAMAQSAEALGTQLLGASPAIVAVREKVQQLLRQSAAHRLPPILVCGETGTGKGLVARMIHGAGPRRDGPFVDVNCAAIPETLLEAELFGFERGAFTDARRAKPGLFQTAHRGTIFLDEVGLLPETLQAKLLKVIEERVVRRLGSTQAEPVDVSILTATNEDLVEAVRAGRFREDLYHRLAVLTIELPPLRELPDDIVLLAEHFLARTCNEYGLPPRTLAPDARAALHGYRWPGNVRELANVIERASLLAEGPILTAAMLGIRAAGALRTPVASAAPGDVPGGRSVASVEEGLIARTLEETSGNISRSAARLGISRNTLKARIKKYGLGPGGSRPVPAEVPIAATVPATPSRSPAPRVRIGVQWESRRLALLRVTLAAPEEEPPAAESSRALDMLIQKVEAFGGRLVEIGATSLVAAFGLEPAEDAPRRAALAAMAMQKAATRGEEQPDGLAIKVAIHAALAPVARVGDTSDIDVDVKRRLWSVLDALLVAAEPGWIVVSQSAVALLARRFAVAETGTTHAPEGAVYRLTEYRSTPFDVGGYMGHFVGRESELELLRTRLEAARAGQGQIVALVGEAGIGKSRLLFEFRRGLASQPVSYHEGRCLSYGSAIPYLPILEVVRTICRLAESDSPETIADKVRTRLEEIGMDAEGSAPYVLHLLGAKDGADRVATQSPEVIKARTFETLHALFLKSSLREPLVLAIEDLHWIDPTSDEYLVSLAERVVGRRILLIATYRPGYRPPWIEKSSATQIALQPLAPHDSLTVVRVVFGTDDVAEPLAELILAKAEGNPFFLEELARAAREQGPASTALTAPDTVQEVLLARIDRLRPDERRLLQAAAVIGKDFSFEVLRATTGLPDETIRRGLHYLRAAEFVLETNLAPQLEYMFKHSLTHDATYGTLSAEERRALHTRIVEALERLYPDRLADLVDRLADHALRGEVWDKAARYLREAGVRAAMRSAHREAVAALDGALAALGHLPRDRGTIEQAIDVRIDLRNSLLPLGEHSRISEILQGAEALAEDLGDRHRLGWVSTYLSHSFWYMGDPDRTIAAGKRALATATVVGDELLKTLTSFHLGQAHHSLGDYRQAIDFLRAATAFLESAEARKRFGVLYAVRARSWLVWCLAELGEFPEGIAQGEAGLRIAEAVDQPFSLITAQVGLGGLYLRRGDLSEAIAVLERALTLSRDRGLPVLFPTVASRLGVAYALCGRLGEALPLLEGAATGAASMRRLSGHSLRFVHLGEAYLLANRIEDAVDAAARALDLAREHKERGYEAWTMRLAGEIAMHREPPDAEAAVASYRRAIDLAQMLGMQPLVALGRLGLAAAYRRAGKTEASRDALHAAIALLRSMQMTFWLSGAEAELRALG